MHTPADGKTLRKTHGYLPKYGHFNLILTTQNCRLREGQILFPETFNGFSISPEFVKKSNFHTLHQVRIIPHQNRLMAELVYSITSDSAKV